MSTWSVKNGMCPLLVAILAALLLQVKTSVSDLPPPVTLIKEWSGGLNCKQPIKHIEEKITTLKSDNTIQKIPQKAFK